MTEPLLLTAAQAAAALNVETSTFNRMLREGRIPACIQHRATFGKERCRRYSRRLLELWAAGVDVETLDPADLVHDLTAARPAPAAVINGLLVEHTEAAS
jgi:excisionase family DNA binding protein